MGRKREKGTQGKRKNRTYRYGLGKSTRHGGDYVNLQAKISLSC